MEVFIENYRGWDIFFSTTNESFYVESDTWDQREKKSSYASCKAFVDDYIKTNFEFKPFRIQHKESGDVILITRIRKDGRLVCEKNGKKEQFSEYYEGSYIIFNPDNEPFFKQINDYKAEIKVLNVNIENLLENVSGTPLKEYKKQIQLP